MEVVHDYPEILVFHEIVTEPELEEIKTQAKPYVSIFKYIFILIIWFVNCNYHYPIICQAVKKIKDI